LKLDFLADTHNYICGVEVEKMSKSKYNVVNPDDLIERYGADTLRMYEMFLVRWSKASHGILTVLRAYQIPA